MLFFSSHCGRYCRSQYIACSEFPTLHNATHFLCLLLNRGQWSKLSRWHIYIHLTNSTPFAELEVEIELTKLFPSGYTHKK